MGDRDIPDPIQEILHELEQVRAREQNLIVQLSILLRALSGQAPARAQRQGPRIRLVFRGARTYVVDRNGTRLQLNDRVRFTGTARTRPGTGRVVGWTPPEEVLEPYIRIQRDVPPGVRVVGSRIVNRKSQSVTFLGRPAQP